MEAITDNSEVKGRAAEKGIVEDDRSMEKGSTNIPGKTEGVDKKSDTKQNTKQRWRRNEPRRPLCQARTTRAGIGRKGTRRERTSTWGVSH